MQSGIRVITGNSVISAGLTVQLLLNPARKNRSIVIDYSGRLALALQRQVLPLTEQKKFRWYDLADRQAPVALFQLNGAPWFKDVLQKVLYKLREIRGTRISNSTIRWAVEMGHQLSQNGTVGLGALYRSIALPENRAWFMNTRCDPAQFQELLDLLLWSLNYPSVHALSEGVNKAQGMNGDIKYLWIEMLAEHFERREHQLLAVLAEAVVEQMIYDWLQSKREQQLTVVHAFPNMPSSAGFPDWVTETAKSCLHLALVKIRPDRVPNSGVAKWLEAAQEIWITGDTGKLSQKAHRNWLSQENISDINELSASALMIKNKENGATKVHKIRQSDFLSLAHLLRSSCRKHRKISQVRQIKTAIAAKPSKVSHNHGLYEKLCDKDSLYFGWLKIKSGSKDSKGVDGVSIASFQENEERELSKLSDELKSHRYRCNPLRRVYLLKSDGSKRDIGIVCVRDKIVQAACMQLIEPYWDSTFSRYSFAFRPRRSAHQAVSVVSDRICSGQDWIVTADIRKCFDTLDQDLLIELLARKIGDLDLLALIRHWLTVDVFEFGDVLPLAGGVPQGAILSPLLANIYLDPLDKYLEKLGIHFVRYADDILLFTGSKEEASSALREMQNFLMEPLHLALKPAKTNYVAADEGFDYLGFRFSGKLITIKKQKLAGLEKNLLARIKEFAESTDLNEQILTMQNFNALIRGIRNYYSIPGEETITDQLKELDEKVNGLAEVYFSPEQRKESSWAMRERLAPGCADADQKLQEKRVKRILGLGYPQIDIPEPPLPDYILEEPKPPPSDPTKNLEGQKMDALIHDKGRLYILVNGSFLTLDSSFLVIKKKKREIKRFQLSDLHLIFLQGFGISVATALQVELAKLDIAMVVAPTIGNDVAVLSSMRTTKASLRSRQVLLRDTIEIIDTGLRMLGAKVKNQAAILKYFAKYRRKTNADLAQKFGYVAKELGEISLTIVQLDPGLADIRHIAMGYEGRAAAAYWRTVRELIPESMGFCSRVTRGASDTANQCLNYLYGMLYSEVWLTVARKGLDPYFGLMHRAKRDQGSLIFDLIEEFRAPFADRLVLSLFGRGFSPELGKNKTLRTKTRKQLAGAFIKRWHRKFLWRGKKVCPAEILESQTKSLADVFEKGSLYKPYKMKW